MQELIRGLNNFINVGHNASGTASVFTKVLSGVTLTMGEIIEVADALRETLQEGLMGAMGRIGDYFGKLVTDALEFDLSIEGLLAQAEKTRKYFSELADEMNFYSSSTGSTTKAMGMLFKATSKSTAGLQTLRGAFSSMVDAGADSDEFISDMLPLLGDFETKTGVGAQQFAMLSTKFQQMFGEKKGITKDIKDLQKALIGTGLKGAQLEQTMQGLTEAAEKLAFTTQGATLNIKELSKSYGKTTAVFKAFGISAQTTTSFLNGLIDPENIEKNMLLMNKMGISYQEFNEMLNSGQGQDKFFDKILNNVGKVAQEANLIQDAGTRYKYLKDTLGLPPEIANKLMKVAPNRMQSELRKIKREMEEAEKKEKWRKELKAREEKYEEALSFLRMQMVAPLVKIINKNRGTIMKFMQNLTPIITTLSEKLFPYLDKLADWFGGLANDVGKLASGDMSISEFVQKNIKSFMNTFADVIKTLAESPELKTLGADMLQAILKGFGLYTSSTTATIIPELTDDLMGVTIDTVRKQNSQLGEMIALAMEAGSLKGKYMTKAKGFVGRLFEDFITDDYLKDVKITSGDKIPESARKMAENTGIMGIGGFRSQQMGELKKMGLSVRGNALDSTVRDTMEDLRTKAAGGKTSEVKEGLRDLNNALLNINDSEEGRLKVQQYMTKLAGELLTGANNAEKVQEISQEQVQSVTKNTKDIIKNNEQTAEAAKDLANKQLTDAEVAAAVQKLMGNKEFVTAVTGSLAKTKDEKISVLEKQIQGFTDREAQLKKEFENLKKESVPAILREWQNFLFSNSNNSILGVLMQSRDLLVDNNEMIRKQRGGGGRSGPSESSLFSAAISSTKGGSIMGVSNSLISNATSNNVKNLQVKQTMFLKSIADATLDSAQVLKYIGRNLIFTPSGLGVNTSAKGNTYEFSGTKITDGVVSGFSVIAPPKPNATPQA